MKYITENELRDMYHKQPFNIYKLVKNDRLTPGARQFLTDFRINVEVVDDNDDICTSEYELIDVALKLKKLAVLIFDYNHDCAQEINNLAILVYQNRYSPLNNSPNLSLLEEFYSNIFFIPLENKQIDILIEIFKLDRFLQLINQKELLPIIQDLRFRLYKIGNDLMY